MKSTHNSRPHFFRVAVILCAALALAAVAASSARSATYDDVAYDPTGKAVAYAPEKPWLGPYDVGAKCDWVNYQYTLWVRPPMVFAFTGYASQTVVWRALYWDTKLASFVASNNWISDTAYANQPANFGRVDRINGTTNIWSNSYWLNADYWQRPDQYESQPTYPLGEIVPYIQVGWYTAAGWVYRLLKVDWEESAINFQSVGGAAC